MERVLGHVLLPLELTFLCTLLFTIFVHRHGVAPLTQSTEPLLFVNSVDEKIKVIRMLALVKLKEIFKTCHHVCDRLRLIFINGRLISLSVLLSGIVEPASLDHAQFEFFLDRHFEPSGVLVTAIVFHLNLLVVLLLFL